VTDVNPSASTGSGTYNSGTGVWTVGSLDKFTRVNLFIEFTVDSGACGTTIINTASLTAVDQEDTNPGNNSSSVDILVEPCLLPCAVPVTTSFTAGVQDGFVLTNGLEESHPSAALLAFINIYTAGNQHFDNALYGPNNNGTSFNKVFGHTFTGLPMGVAGASLEIGLQVIGTQLSSNDGISLYMTGPNSFAWSANIGVLAGVPWKTGASTVLTLGFAALPGGTSILSNMNLSQTLDVYVQDDTAIDYIRLIITTCPVDIEVVKTVSDSSPAAGDTISYNIVVSNLSGNTATGIVVTDLLPLGVKVVSATASTGPGTYNSGTGVWTVGSLDKFTRVNLFIEFTVDSGACGTTITNTATLTAVDQEDTNPGNNSSSVDIIVEPCAGLDLKLDKFHNLPFTYGQSGSYTFLISNEGTGTASSPITVVDVLPDGLIYDSFTDLSGDWACNSSGQTATCTYTGPNIAPGGSLPTLIINLKIVPIGVFPGGSDLVTNCADVKHIGDINSANNQGCVDTVITP
jgi:uncharacterized repeat protein (TIGR01451 family)